MEWLVARTLRNEASVLIANESTLWAKSNDQL
jgi:hypothetical protein